MDIIIQLIILLFSVVIHEVSHGSIANMLGDPTAKQAGRLTINPLKHLDLWGSFIVPITLFLLSAGNFVFGWAKPVPFNPYNLKNPKRDAGFIGLAGPLSNIFLAIFFGIILRVLLAFGIFAGQVVLSTIFQWVILINITLACLNLIPVPPLDGSKILAALLPSRYEHILYWLERYSLFILFLVVFFVFNLIQPIIYWIFKIIAGI